MIDPGGGATSTSRYGETADVVPPPLRSLVADLQSEFERRVARRRTVEERWIEDLSQYNGRYLEGEVTRQSESDVRSRAFVNMTRPKTKVLRARLGDIMFPTDERNWALMPTPVPELTAQAAQAATQQADAAKQAAEQQAAGQPPDMAMAQAQQAAEIAQLIERRMAEARRCCALMEDQIADQLEECGYAEQYRLAIYDMCMLGIGVMKGPVVDGVGKRAWHRRPDGQWGIERVEQPKPAFWRVDPWTWFPDMDATTIAECESFYERHLLNAKQLRELAQQRGFVKDAIRRLLVAGARQYPPEYVSDLRAINNQMQDHTADRYEVKEYYGTIPADRWREFVLWYNGLPESEGDPIPEEVEAPEPDPLMEQRVCIWFCQGEILKMSLYGYDSGEPIYSVASYERDPGSLFGFGIPYIMRTAQRVYNSAWRALLDNMALSAGPMMIVDQNVCEPVEPRWEIRPRKIWRRIAGAPAGAPAIEFVGMPSNQVELGGVIDRCRQIMDDETNLPLITQGDQGPALTPTYGGMVVLQNAANVTFREVVKQLDDNLTVPNIRRLYDWNMQFSDREEIKGDFEVVARGTSVLLVREMQAANLFAMATTFTQHPVLGPLTKPLEFLRKAIQANMLPASELAMSDEEYRQWLEQQAQQQTPDPAVLKAEAQMNIAEIDSQTRLQIAKLEFETAMMRLAEQKNMQLEELRARLARASADRDSKERIFAAEAGMESRMAGRQSGGYL